MDRRWLRSTTSGAVLCFYAAGLIVLAMLMPWWRMECHAPQYGPRELAIDVSATSVAGDIKELDGLGHYIGMKSITELAPLERLLAPYGIVVVALLALSLPFLRKRWMRVAAAAAVVAVPVVFALDLWAWQQYTVTHLDPHAALNMIANRVQARLLGDYSVAQFKVRAKFETGFWFTAIAALNALGFVAAEWGKGIKKRVVPEVRRHAKLAAAATATVLVALSMSASAATREVGPKSAYPTIAAAIAGSAAGDVVLVHPGVYHEHVLVDRPLLLRAEPGAVVDGDGRGTVLTVERGPSTVRGFLVRGSGDSLVSEDAGVRLNGAPDTVVDANQFEDVLFGVLATDAARAHITNNRVVGKDIPIPRRGDGIRVHDAAGSVVDDNVVDRSRDLAIWQSNEVVARRNLVRSSRYGLHYMYCDDDVFEDNVFEQNQVGAAIMYSRRLTLRGNRFVGSRGPSAYGLLLKVADDLLVESNWFLDNTAGIFLEDTPSSLLSRAEIRGNVIGGNDAGIDVQQSVAGVVFTENAFVGNRVQVQAVGGTPRGDANVWSAAGRGNYWSDYVGFDADRDGTGDTPYRSEQFFESLTERWPAVGLLRYGPAAEALEVGARAFPIVKPSPVLVDEHPLIRPSGSTTAPPPAARGSLEVTLAGALALCVGAWATVRIRREPAEVVS